MRREATSAQTRASAVGCARRGQGWACCPRLLCAQRGVLPNRSGRLLDVVIPIHDDNPVRRTPIITYLLIALNFVVFFSEPVVSHIGVGSQTAQQVCSQQAYFDKWAAIPRELTRDKPRPPHRYVLQTNNGRFA